MEPYQSFKVIDVGLTGPGKIKLSWQRAADKNYRIDGTTDLVTWQPLVDSIVGGVNGPLSRTMDISAVPQTLYMRVPCRKQSRSLLSNCLTPSSVEGAWLIRVIIA